METPALKNLKNYLNQTTVNALKQKLDTLNSLESLHGIGKSKSAHNVPIKVPKVLYESGINKKTLIIYFISYVNMYALNKLLD